MNCKLLIWKPAASIPCYDKLISCAENGMNLWQCAKVTNPSLELILWKQTAAELLWTHFIRNFYSCQSYSYKARSVNSHFFIRNLLRQFPCISTVSLCISDKTGFLITATCYHYVYVPQTSNGLYILNLLRSASMTPCRRSFPISADKPLRSTSR